MLKREAPRTQSEYVLRRRLDPKEVVPAIGVGIGVGVLAFYVAYLFLQRTPLEPESRLPAAPRKRLLRGAVG
jgi:hypothetical protein